MRRRRMTSRKSKRLFRRTGSGAHKKNFRAAPMRGGIRL